MSCIQPLNLLKKQACVLLLAMLSIFIVNGISSAESGNQPVYKAAIFVENRAGKTFDNKTPVLEDFITSRITEKGFSVISREVVTDSLKNYGAEKAKSHDGEKLDTLLSQSASALRLAQLMGADYIIVTSLTSFGAEKKSFKGYGVETVNMITTLRASYKILEGVQGGTLVSDTIKVSKSERSTERSRTENSDMINELLDEAASKIAESLGKKQIIQPPQKPSLVEITIACGMQDTAQLPVSVPDIRMTKEGKMVVEKDPLEVQLLDVTVELNGAVIGSAPGVFKTPPGPHKIRLTREGFKDWERTVNANEGQKLKVVLQMTDNGYKRWRDNTAFLHELKDKEKLTDAEVEAIKGHARMLRQSGFKVDVKEDIKGDIKKGTLNSIFGLLFLQ